ncbi:MAG: hypothetical protein JWP61_2479 [Friedmanniella sp.]|nr:hypothetical protein [Friedmanniella sp.]
MTATLDTEDPPTLGEGTSLRPGVNDLVTDPTSAGSGGAPVEVFGIRHHGPGSARSLLAALEAYGPDVVLIEGPADADSLIPWVTAEGTEPPVALLAYAPEEPRVAAFWPYAVFSPEWQAMRWALERGVEVAFCDLPAAQVLAPRPATLLDEEEPEHEADPDAAVFAAGDPRPGAGVDLGPGGQVPPGAGSGGLSPEERARWLAAHARLASRDPLAALASAAGYDDPERWWDDVVELRHHGGPARPASPFPALTEAMAELRLLALAPRDREADRERRREAYMRQTIRAARKRGRQRVAVVCGAWHAPALTWPLPPAVADARVLRGTPKRKVALTWVPWTHQRLATATGYGAGVTSPGWYHHLWTAPDQPVVRWLAAVAHALRDRDLPVSSAHVIEAVRLAETLAALRNRPMAGLAEVTEATRAVLCEGDDLAVRFVTDRLVVGQALGSVAPGVPTVPLDADLQRQSRTLRLRREPQVRTHDLDLRTSIDQARSRLFHRLRLLDLAWVVPGESTVVSQGTFREVWESQWQPEYAIALVEAAVWGTTVESAAAARVAAVSREGSLQELTGAVERCLLADLPDALAELLRTLEAKAALDADVVHLMDALPALARAERYGDVRGTDTSVLRSVAQVLVLRICAGLTLAVVGAGEDDAAAMRLRIDGVSAAVGLLEARADDAGGLDLRARWLATCRATADRADLHGLLGGRLVRLLADAEELDDVPLRFGRALSHGVPAARKAAWVEGFFADGATLLIHDAELRGLLDGWVAGLADEEFADVLPLVRRTFGTFSAAERRALGGRLAHPPEPVPPGPHAGAVGPPEGAEEDLPALRTVDLLLGWRR